MRMNSLADTAFAEAAFSFVPPSLIERSVIFRQGEALIAGKISPQPALLRFGARITEEGGADVPATWAAVRLFGHVLPLARRRGLCWPARGYAVTHRADRSELAPARRRRLIALGLLRALATTIVLVALYYLLPLDHIRNVPVTLAVGLVILLAVTLAQLRIIVTARYPAVRAIEALAATLPLFLLLFASAYIAMANANPANFSTHLLTRTDALYFTVTVFTTVGFGDITAVSQSARLVVTVQMLLDLVALGLVVRAFVGAVQLARQQAAPAAAPAVGPGLPPGQAPQQGDDVQ